MICLGHLGSYGVTRWEYPGTVDPSTCRISLLLINNSLLVWHLPLIIRWLSVNKLNTQTEKKIRESQFRNEANYVNYSRHVGEKVRMDLQRKQNLPSNKLATLMSKFDEMKTSGRMMPTATLATGTLEGRTTSIVVITRWAHHWVSLLAPLTSVPVFPCSRAMALSWSV